MSTLQTLVDKVVKQTSTGLQSAKISNFREIASHANGTVSVESASSASSNYNKAMSIVDRVISEIELSGESVKLTQAQKDAARFILPYACDPEAYASAIKAPKVSDVQGVSIGAESFNLDTADSSVILQDLSGSSIAKVSREAYDGQLLSNFVAYNIGYNLAAARQDDFCELFFPTITIDPLQAGIDVSITYTSLWNEYTHGVDGKVKKDELARIPIAKAMYDKSVFAIDNQLLIPVYRENKNKDFFLSEKQEKNKDTGKEILTAPLKIGKEVDFLSISTTDEILAKGEFDNTDSLDRNIELKNLYINVNGGTHASDTFKVSVQPYAHKNFYPNPQGHHKDMLLNFKHDAIYVKVDDIRLDGSKLITADSANKSAGYVFALSVSVNGECNTMTSVTKLTAGGVELVGIYNKGGESLAAGDPGYDAIFPELSKLTIVGYDLRASRTNSNIRTRGQMITNDSYVEKHTVPLRQGVTVIYSPNNQMGTDNDVGNLTTQGQLAGIYTTNCGVNALIDFDSKLKSIINIHNNTVGTAGAKAPINVTGHITGHIVNAWYSHTSLDISSLVTSISSSVTEADVRAALRRRIFKEVIEMYRDSNYGVAYQLLRGVVGGKIGVAIGTDPLIESIIAGGESTFSLGDKFEARVVSTLDPALQNRIFITFTVFDESRNSQVNPLNFGNCIWSPTLSYEATITRGNATSRELHNNPRFLHLVHLPILASFEISDVMNVFKKISINMHSV